MTLTKEQLGWLTWLHENGGSGWLDQYGRVIANGANSKQGSQVSWLNLFVKGMVVAHTGRIVMTDLGKVKLRIPLQHGGNLP